MIKLIISQFRTNIKKYMAILLSVMSAVVFILVSESIYSTYEEVKIRNAYSYGGEWDFKITGKIYDDELPENLSEIGYVENHYTAILDEIPHDERTGPYAEIAEYYMLSIKGIDEDVYTVIPDVLTEGTYPVKSNEIVVPDNFVLNGKKYEVGDTVCIKIAERRDINGEITQSEELAITDTYLNLGSIEYIICGKFSTKNLTSGVYLNNAYTGRSQAETVTGYYRMKDHSFTSYEETSEELKEKFGEEKAAANEYVGMTIDSTYKSDYFRATRNGVTAFQIIITVVAISVIVLNLFQIGETEKYKVRQLNTLGCSLLKIVSVYVIPMIVCELVGQAVGTVLNKLILKCSRKGLIRLLNSKFSNFSFENINKNKLLIIFLAMSVFTIFFMVCKVNSIIRNKKKNHMDRTVKKACKNLVELSYLNIRNRALFNSVITVSTVIIIITGSLVLSLHPGMVEKSAEYKGIIAKYGHYYIYTDIDLEQYIEKNNKIEGVNFLKKQIGGDILAEGFDEDISFCLGSVNELLYNEYRQNNPNMVEYQEFLKGDVFYIMDDALSDEGMIIRNTNLERGDKLIYSNYTEREKKYEITIKGVISKDVEELFDNHRYANIIVNESYLYDKGLDLCYLYRFYCKPGKVKEVGEALKQLTDSIGVGLMDTSEVFELAEDNHSIQVFVISIISSLFIIIGIAGIIIAIRLDGISRTEEFHLYKTLGMDKKIAAKMQFFEYFSVWLTAVIFSLIILMISSYTILKGLIGYYSVPERTIIINMLIVSFALIFVLYLVSVIISGSRYKKMYQG